MASLPEYVLSNIFVRLRAKQLVQMRCLSRSWKSILSESFFIKSHLDRSVNNNDGTLLVCSESDSITAMAHPSRSPHLEVTNSIKLPVNPQSKDSRGRVIGSVHGLICFDYGSLDYSNANNLWSPYQYNSVVYIWNPCLSTVICLPPYCVISDFVNCTKINHLRFGFDPKTDDYKVVNLAQAYTTQLVKLQIEIYNMKKGSWELINQKIPSHVKWVKDKDQICLDGHLHWLACGWDFVESILAFDLGAETFHEIPLPDSIRDFEATSNYLGVLMRKLCVMSAFQLGECEAWVMDEYGVAESWVKYHVFPTFRGNIRPYGFTLHNEFLFRVLPHGLALYDPVAAATKLFKLHGGYDEIGRVVEYVDSLVWVTPAK